MRRAALSVLVRAALPAAALAFGMRGVDWRAVTDALRGARVGPLAALVGVNGLMMTVKAARLRWLLGRAAGLRCCLLAKLTASAMNNMVPFRGGDLARLWMLERHAGISKTVAAAVAVVESLFELLALAVVALIGALVIRQRWALVSASLLAVAAGGLIGLGRHLARQGTRPAAEGHRAGDRLRRLRARIQPGLGPLREPGLVARVLGASLVTWTLEVMMVLLCSRALHLPVGPALSALMLLAINVALAVPTSPAGAGAFEAAVVFVLTLAGTAKSPAVAFALLYHVVQVVPVVCAGALVVWRSGLTLNRLPPDARRPQPAQPMTRAIASPSQPLTPTV